MTKYYPSLIHRLEVNSKLDLVTGCVEWQLSRDRAGYGKIKVKGKHLRTHRVVAELFLPDYSKDLYVLHRCDNPPCINPQHLFMGTNSDNQLDAVSKKRWVNNSPWLYYNSPEQVSDIIAFRSLGLTQRQIADLVGLSQQGVCNILKREGVK